MQSAQVAYEAMCIDLARVTAERDALRELVKAKDELLAAHRLQVAPSEATFVRLRAAQDALLLAVQP